jgi:hypothetical protein
LTRFERAVGRDVTSQRLRVALTSVYIRFEIVFSKDKSCWFAECKKSIIKSSRRQQFGGSSEQKTDRSSNQADDSSLGVRVNRKSIIESSRRQQFGGSSEQKIDHRIKPTTAVWWFE